MNNKNSFQLAWHEVMELRLKKLAIVVMSGVQLLLPESLVGQVTELDPIDPESRLEMYDFEEAEAVWDHSVAFGLTLATGNSDVYL